MFITDVENARRFIPGFLKHVPNIGKVSHTLKGYLEKYIIDNSPIACVITETRTNLGIDVDDPAMCRRKPTYRHT